METVYGTVCSGIECAGLAADALDGWTQAFCAEVDPFANAVLKRRRPDVPNMGNVTTLAERMRRNGEPIVDVLIAGTPCQSFSIAGLQRSLDDERGNLTLELVRILDAIDEVRDAVGLLDRCTLVWENVPGVLSTRDNAFGCLLAALVGAYDPVVPFGKRGRWPRAGLVRGPKRQACWRILDAQWFGVAQRRRRLFLVAGAGAGFDPSAVLLEPEGMQGNPPPRRGEGKDVAVPLTQGATDGGGHRIDVDAADTNLIVHSPDLAKAVRPRNTDSGAAERDGADDLVAYQQHGSDLGVMGALRRGHGDVQSGVPFVAYGGNNTSGPIDVATARSAHGSPHGRLDFEMETFLVGGGDVTHTLNTSKNGGHSSEDGTGRGVPIMAFDSRQDCVSSTETFGSLGSSSPQSQAIASHQNQRAEVTVNDTAGALNSGGGKPGQGYPAIMDSSLSVRRLTPMECERLQGLPDGWTDVPYRGKPAADGPRYRAIGNGMAVPCVRWILERLDRHMKENA